MVKYTWEDAMTWWKESGDFAPLIRNAATRIIGSSPLMAGQGIGSSDVNHEVYHMYGSFLNYKAYCEEHKENFNWINFLLDVTADCR